MRKILFITVAFLLLISACERNKFKINVSDYKTDIEINRFDTEIFNFKKDSAQFYIVEWQKKYGSFFDIYNSQVFQISSPENADYATSMSDFVNYWKGEGIENILKKEFSDISEQEKQLKDAFAHLKYYFPDANIHRVYTFFSAFGISVITSDSLIGIGLDKYLGPKYTELYEKARWNTYQQKRMRKEMIAVDVVQAVAGSMFPYSENTGTLLENMIYEGKIQYFLNCMLPEISDTLKWKYSEKQLNWANSNQKNIWNYIAEQKLLFSTDKTEIKKYVGEAPFTAPFSANSAPRAASFVGYKIVEKFMENNSNISLEDLMKMNDSRKILTQSKYNP